ncbi:MAG: hypothetical protein U1D32_03730 [Patescibacteria group bacterium]|nr:hypothetical protein [Patescibacteria group bacterium]
MSKHRSQTLPDLPADRFDFDEHPWGLDELQSDTVRQLRAIDSDRWAGIAEALESDAPAYEVDWCNLPPAGDLAARLEVMGRVKALLPPDNIETHKENHNVTIENHLKLLFEAAGRQDNLRTFLEFARGRIAEAGDRGPMLAEQGLLLWAPAAEIMGWYGLKERLEKTAFKALMPGEMSRIRETYVTKFEGSDEEARDKALVTATERYDRLIGDEIREQIPDLRGKVGVNARRKSYYSIWRKCRQRDQADYELSDFFGARVVITPGSERDEDWAIAKCYEVAGILMQRFAPDLDRYKDYIEEPKPNGYRSVHLTVEGPDGLPLEIQVRTAAMHELASGDPDVSHLAYEASTKLTPGKLRPKKRGKRGRESTRLYRWRQQAATRIREAPTADLAELRPPETLFFTDDGNLQHMPEGATALDAAFHADSDRALRTKEIWKNGKLARFGDPIQTGDCIRIECVPERPDRDGTWADGWLKTVKTPRARKRLRRAELERHGDEYRRRGWKKIREAFPGLTFPDPKEPLSVLDEDARRRVMRKYSVRDGDMLLRRIGAGRVRVDSLKYWIDRRREAEDGA